MSPAATLFVVLVVAGVAAVAGLRRLMFGPATQPQADGDISVSVDGIYHRGDDSRHGHDVDGDGDAGGGDSGGGGDGGGGGD